MLFFLKKNQAPKKQQNRQEIICQLLGTDLIIAHWKKSWSFSEIAQQTEIAYSHDLKSLTLLVVLQYTQANLE
jgi:hypothetical protein